MHWRLVSLVTFLTVSMMPWLAYELGLFGYTKSYAAETVKEPSTLTQESLENLNKMLQEKSKSLVEKEDSLKEKEKVLVEKEKFLLEQMNRYEKVTRDLKKKLAELETKKEDRIASFRAIYEKMESKHASKIIDQMDTSLAAKILAGMRQEKAAEIMAKMDHQKAKVITERYLSSVQAISTSVNEVQKNE